MCFSGLVGSAIADHDDETDSQPSTTRFGGSLQRSPSPDFTERTGSPLTGGVAPAGVSSGLAGIGKAIGVPSA